MPSKKMLERTRKFSSSDMIYYPFKMHDQDEDNFTSAADGIQTRDSSAYKASRATMKVLLISFAFCIAQVASAGDGLMRHVNAVQSRPLHKPSEQQPNPMIIPIYTPVQQYPVQQYPSVQPYPVQQYPVQYIPVQTYPQPHPQFQHHQQYPQIHYYPQIYPGIPC